MITFLPKTLIETLISSGRLPCLVWLIITRYHIIHINNLFNASHTVAIGINFEPTKITAMHCATPIESRLCLW